MRNRLGDYISRGLQGCLEDGRASFKEAIAKGDYNTAGEILQEMMKTHEDMVFYLKQGCPIGKNYVREIHLSIGDLRDELKFEKQKER